MASGANETRRFAITFEVRNESCLLVSDGVHTHGLSSGFSLLQDSLSFPLPTLLLVAFFRCSHLVANGRCGIEGVEWVVELLVSCIRGLLWRFEVDQKPLLSWIVAGGTGFLSRCIASRGAPACLLE